MTALALCLAGPVPGQAQAQAPEAPFVPSLPQDLAGVPGTWDLAREGSTRRCVLTLGIENGSAGRRVSFPSGCRRALPILDAVAGWLFADGNVRLVDRNVRPVLLFSRQPDARSLLARSEAGERYSFVPLQIAAMAPPAAAAGFPPPTPPEVSPTPPEPARLAGTAVSVAGTYALDRFREPDVCRVELIPGDPGKAPLRVLDGCRDTGLAVFDPVSWRYADGRLTLVAKRGHLVGLVADGPNRWRRDPDIGTTFVLRRVGGP